MARGQIPVTISTRSGVVAPAETSGDPTNGHYVQNSGSTRIHVRNTNASATARTLTIKVYRTVDGQAVTSRTTPIAAGDIQVFGPFPVEDYGSQLLLDVDNAELKLRAFE